MATPALPLRLEQAERQVVEIVRELLRDLGREDRAALVSADAALERDLGIASLDLLELVVRCEARFGVELPDAASDRARTAAALARAIVEAEPAGLSSGYVIRQPRRDPAPEPSDAETFLEVLRRHAEFDPERVHAHVLDKEGGADLTYGALLQAATQTAAGLQALGLRRGETVAIMLPSSAEFFHAFFGIMLAGGTALPIFPPVRPDQIEEYVLRQVRVLRHAEIRFLIAFDRVKTLSHLMRLRLTSEAEVVTVEELREAGTGSRLRSVEPAHYPVVQYTSGSTGDPKGVALTHGNLLANLRGIGAAVGIGPADSVVSWMPLCSDLGLVGTWLFSLYHGLPFTLLNPLDFINRPERWLWAIHHARGTLSAGPNFGYELCARKAQDWALEGLDLSSWRAAVNAGEAVLPATMDRFVARFGGYGFRRSSFVAAYGLAESTVALAFPEVGREPRLESVNREVFERTGRAEPPGGQPSLCFVSSGPPLPFHAIRIVDDNGAPLPERTQGRLLFQGPSCTEGYFRNPECTAAVLSNDGWMDSGDLAYLAEGEVFLTGRRKECIIHEGRSVSPHDLELAAAEAPGVQPGAAVAFGVPDAAAGTERIVIAVETLARHPADVERVAAGVKATLAATVGVDADVRMLLRGAVPRTSNGKFRRNETRQLYLEGRLHAPPRPLWKQLANLWRGAVAPGTRRGAVALASQVGRGWLATRRLLTYGYAGLAARTGDFQGLRAAARTLQTSSLDGAMNGPGLYVANHASPDDVWALVGEASGPVAIVDSSLLGLSREARWALSPLAVPPEHALANGRSVLVLPDSSCDAPAARCRYRLEAFQAAQELRVPVHPVAICRNGSGLLLSVGGALDAGVGGDAAAMRERVRREIVALLERRAHV